MKKSSAKNRSVRFLISLALTLSAFTATPAHAVAGTIYVAPSGSVGTGASCTSPGYVGGASIADAIAAAVDGDTVILCNGTFSVTSQIFIDEKEITVSGESTAQNTIINGAGSTTGIFKIISKKNVTIQNLTFYRGNSAQGGGAILLSLRPSQSLSTTRHLITNNIFAQNQAASQGGAISGGGDNMGAGDFRGILTISNNTFVENKAGVDGGAIDMGAVAFDPARIVVQANKFLYNRATVRSGGAVASNFNRLTSINNIYFLNTTGDIGNSETLYGGFKISGDLFMNDLTSGRRDCRLENLSPTVAQESFTDNPYCLYFSDTQPADLTSITRVQGIALAGNLIPQSPLISAYSAGLNSVNLNLAARSAGSSAITQYAYSLDGGSFVNFPAGASATQSVTGLAAGTTYQVRLKATSAAGTSYESMPYQVSTPAAFNSSTGNGNIACSVTGYVTIASKVITSNSNCVGSVATPAGTTSIAAYAFEGSGVTSINIPNTVTSIGAAAFRAATSLTTVTFESGSVLNSIGSAAFERTAIASITLPNSLTFLGNYAFWSNSALTSIVIPEGIYGLYQNSFAYITTLTSVTLPSTLGYIDMETFKGATALTSLIIPKGVSSIGANAFTDTTALTSYTYCGTVSDAGLTSAGLGGKTKTCLPPVSFDCPTGGGTYQVEYGTIIGTSGVCGGDLTLDSSVRSINTYAFSGSQITSLTIPASVTSILGSPFGGYGSRSLVSISVSDSNANFSSVGGVLFNKTQTELILYPAKKPGSSYSIPSTVRSIRYYGFASNSYLTSIDIPNTVTTMGGQIFLGSKALTTVNIGTGLAGLGIQAFAWLPTLTSINVAAANTTFASIDGVLYDKDIVTLFAYPAGKSGTSFVAPNSVLEIATTAFGGVVNLQTADLSSVYYLSDQVFMDATSIREVIFGESLDFISPQTFQSATNLRKVTLGSALTWIEDGAFWGNNRLYCVIYTGTESYVQNFSYPNGVVPVGSSSDCLPNPAITLSTSTIVGTVGVPISTYSISSTGGSISTYSITPDISSIPGLSFNTSTGIISGTPLEVAASQTFTVTATNAADTTTRTFSLSVRPKPIPFLKSLTKPKMHLKDGLYVCSAGTYEFGYTIGGIVDSSTSGVFFPSKYIYNLLINGIAQSQLAITSAASTNIWSIEKPLSGSLISCSVSISANSLSTLDLSTENTEGYAAAQSALKLGKTTATEQYKLSLKANTATYMSTVRANRTKWQKKIDATRANYYTILDRLKASPGSGKMIADATTALEVMKAAKAAAQAEYVASRPLAIEARDASNATALSTRDAAIAKANAIYGTFIESIGYGVLIP